MSKNECCAELRKKLEESETEIAIQAEVIDGQRKSFDMKYGMMRDYVEELTEERDELLKQRDDLTLINAALVERREHEIQLKDCLKSDMRALQQRVDCTYYDAAPGTIECPPDNPCELHMRERLEAQVAKLRSALEEAEDAFEQAIVDMDGPSRPGYTNEDAMKLCQQMCLQPALEKVRAALKGKP